MTLDEAIKHAEEVAEEKENEGKLLCQSESASIGCLACAEEHRQLAEWLKDYKRLLEQQPSDDYVSRQQAIEFVNQVIGGKNDFADAIRDGVEAVLSALPPVTPTQNWIPVSERLPEDRNIVLVTAYWHETYQVMMASYFGEGLWWCVPFNNCGDHMQKLNPKAWQPLPKPYEEKRGNENE